jgi:hypothetical protein
MTARTLYFENATCVCVDVCDEPLPDVVVHALVIPATNYNKFIRKMIITMLP